MRQTTEKQNVKSTAAPISFQEKLSKTRAYLLSTLEQELDSLITDQLKPQAQGLPFTNLKDKSPQAEAIMRVINCLYHFEQILQNLDGVSSKIDLILASPWLYPSVTQLYEALASLDNVVPEVQSLISANYQILLPIYSALDEALKKSPNLRTFNKLETSQKAKVAIEQGLELLDPESTDQALGNSLVAAFTKIEGILNVILRAQGTDLTYNDIDEQIELFCKLLLDLDANPFFKKLSYENIKEEAAFRELMDWILSVQQQGLQFTPLTLKKYISFVNEHLPNLIVFIDKIERENYLIAGKISDKITPVIDRLSLEANAQLTASPLNFTQKLITIESLAHHREQQITTEQVQSIQKILSSIRQQEVANQFYTLLKKFDGQKLINIYKPDRKQLALLYPYLQMDLAHANLDLENSLSKVLQLSAPANKDMDRRISELLKTQSEVEKIISHRIAAEEVRIKIAEKAREKIIHAPASTKSFTQRTETRVEYLITNKKIKAKEYIGVQEHIKPVELTDLNSLRSHFTNFQNLKLSLKIKNIKDKTRQLFPDNLDSKDLQLFLQSLDTLHDLLIALETQNNYSNIWDQLKFIGKYKDVAAELYKKVDALSPVYTKHLAPLVEELSIIGKQIYAIANGAVTYPKGIRSQENEDKAEANNNDMVVQATIPKTPDIDTLIAQLPKKYEPTYKTHIERLQNIRKDLLQRCKDTLSEPLTSLLHERPEGIPFVKCDDDPPQVETIKKVVNSIYTIEMLYKVWQDKNLKQTTKLDKVIYLHQLMAAASQLYRALELFDSAPELQTFVANNYDLLAPVYKMSLEFINESGLPKFMQMDPTKKTGDIIGQGINLLQPEKDKESYSSPIIQMLNELPTVLNEITSSINKDAAIPAKSLRIKEKKVEVLSKIFEYLFTDQGSTWSLVHSAEAITSFKEIRNQINQQLDLTQETSIDAYQKWIDTYYPIILTQIDRIEADFNLAPGLLSKPLIAEMDPVAEKINDVIEEINEKKKKSNKKELKNVLTSANLVKLRIEALQVKNNKILAKKDEFHKQQTAAKEFFDILALYKLTSLEDLSENHFDKLKKLFVLIQVPLANCNLDLSNELVLAFKNTDLTGLNIDHLLHQSHFAKHFLQKQIQGLDLKLSVLDAAITDLGPIKLEQFTVATVPDKKPAPKISTELEIVTVNSLSHARGNLSYLQDLKMSEYSNLIKEEFSLLTENYLSERVMPYLKKEEGVALHTIADTDPNLIRQIKNIENSLTKINLAMIHFEEINKKNSMVFQAQAFIYLRQEALQAIDFIYALPPDLKEHYSPFINEITSVYKKISSIDYNKEDLNEFFALLKDAKMEVLRRRRKDKKAEKNAFFTVVMDQVPADMRKKIDDTFNLETDNIPKTTRELRQRAAKLTTKYAYLATPELENARLAFIEMFPTVFSNRPDTLAFLTKEEFADEEYMEAEISRLTKVFSEKYGYNFATSAAFYNLFKQILRVGSEFEEFGSMVNQLVSDDYVKIKDQAYEELIFRISQREDDLGWKAGSILDTTITTVNELFLSVALELDMPFTYKYELYNQTRYLKLLQKKVEQDLVALNALQKIKPTDVDLPLKINLKQDKLTHIKKHIVAVEKELEKPDVTKNTRSLLLDNLFKVALRKQLKKMGLESPIIEQYSTNISDFYNSNKEELLQLEDAAIDGRLNNLLTTYRKNHQQHYVLTSRTYQMLTKFSKSLPNKYTNVKNYTVTLANTLSNPKIEITLRADLVLYLPQDKNFNRYINSVEGGPNFLTKLLQFIERVVSSAFKSLTTHSDFLSLYQHKRFNQTLENLEQIEKHYSKP
ncbi:MAG: hypothetical protein WC627_10935 [Legionella sp.]|jgi:hypothetical protein